MYKDLIDRIADKTLSFGCAVKVNWTGDGYGEEIVRINDRCLFPNGDEQKADSVIEDSMVADIVEILGHPIYIGRILNLVDRIKPYFVQGNAESKGNYNMMKIIELWDKCGFNKSLQEIAEKDTEEARELFAFIESII